MRAWLLAGAAIALSGCVSVNDDPSMYASQGFAPGAPNMANSASSGTSSDSLIVAALESASDAPAPVPPPAADAQTASLPANEATDSATIQSLVQADTAVDALNRGITQTQSAQPVANLYSAPADPSQVAVVPEPAPAEPAAVASAAPEVEEQPAAAPVQELAVVAPPKKKTFFSRLFGSQTNSSKKTSRTTTKRPTSSRAQTASVASAGGNALPGVRLAGLMGVTSDDDTRSSDSGNIQLASAAGLARLAPNGLHLQTEKVKVDCFSPKLISVLHTVERKYGRPVVVTSGYRSPKHNRRVGGASGSRHTTCEAADIQVEGVSKWQLAKYLRSMPGRGGVGTYCYTESVHIDIGNARDWNWRCRRRKK
ncbi:YcbK family protein [Hoeflea sp. G2-23]|uniref:YcbK family protein n=1 Tax=Hoeflea algicola TaxID=2983763 RepID=A0ABT3Z5L4_9HYPH|nr:YcbK family protein [Hoeflea algicola]MCY0147050.1 YcbK family protein [Hoeflea algicola]